MIGVIYLITCVDNKKKYIGQTTLTPPEQRWQQHLNLAKRNTTRQYIHRAIRCHGKDSFIFEVIAEAQTREELDLLEKKYISAYNTISPNGYNVAVGGQGASGIFTEERKRKIGEKSKGRLHSKETRQKMSLSHKNHPATKLQRQRTKEANAHKVRCIETALEFESIKKAKEWLRTQGRSGDIQSHLQGKQKTAGGYHWQRIILELQQANAC